ncbi:stalk domain-containing protein [Aedoeadaptatus acetigenes]|uniref:stalk domain-containing protein n=1 Tax=Aedoeadaptatus acetigenes TaxID=2981723 RepID=UPI0011DD7EDF|nr:stalk domain-containing protein [Aedoeadaptatus acetigenes]MCU6786011.1 stalk domain-containing protein [Aedoeadaptatus acetigenes]
MKKILSLALALVCLLAPNMAHAESSKTYDVPVALKHATAEKESMANKALSPVAEVKEEGGKFTYKVYVKPLNFMNQQGNLTNLFVLTGGRREATGLAGKGEYTKCFTFESGAKENMVDVAVWVDVMDQMQGGTPGAGEQKARLVFDWSQAKMTKAAESNKTPEAKGDKKAITILVNGKEVKTDSPAFIKDGRTMVPVRFISEALGLKVGWDQKTRTVTVDEGAKAMKLTIGSKKIVRADGKETAIDVPAMIKGGRTMVPIRAIGELSGAKVDWNAANREVIIQK